jgi:hypothetical protein
MVHNMDWKIEAFLKHNNKRFKFVSGVFSGTVFSGHPTRTTLGNSLRVILYFRFMLWKARVPITNYKLYIGGDDSFLLLDP